MRGCLPSLVLALAGCAQLPHDLPPRPAMKAPETLTTLAALAATSAPDGHQQTLPARWWLSFGLADLDRLIETALKDAPDWAVAEARLRTAEQRERLARLDARAHYQTDASIVRERMSRNGLFPPPIGGSTFTQTDITENLSYTLDWWGRNRALIQAAGDTRDAVREEAVAVREALAAAVADSYFAWAAVAARLAVARSLAQVHRSQRDLLDARFELGLDSALPLIDARRRVDLDQDQIHALEYLADSLRYRIGALIGADPDHAAALPTPELDKARLAPLPARLPLDWLGERPDVAALRSRVEAASDLSAAARADFYPNLDLRMMLGLETLDLAKLFQGGSLSASIGPALHLPLFNTGTLRAKLALREADYAAAVAAYNGAILEAARQAADAYTLIVKLEQRSRAQQQALRQTGHTRALVVQRRTLGLAGRFDSLEADAAVLGQQLDEIALQGARLRARVALFKALGGDALARERAPHD